MIQGIGISCQEHLWKDKLERGAGVCFLRELAKMAVIEAVDNQVRSVGNWCFQLQRRQG